MKGALYVVMLFGVVIIFLGVPITLLANAIGAGARALRGGGGNADFKSPRRIAIEYLLVGLIPSVALASMALGVRSQFPEKVSPLAAGLIVTLALAAITMQSMGEQIGNKDNPVPFRLALWTYFFRIILGVVAGAVAVLYFAPEFLARFGVVLIRISEWLLDLPILGWVVGFAAVCWILYLASAALKAVLVIVGGVAQVAKSE